MFVISPLAELTKSARSRKIGTDFGENSITIFYNAHLPYSLSLYSVIHWEVYYCFNYNSETIRRRASMRTLLLTICIPPTAQRKTDRLKDLAKREKNTNKFNEATQRGVDSKSHVDKNIVFNLGRG